MFKLFESIVSIFLMTLVIITSSWMMSKLFLMIFSLVMRPLYKLAELKLEAVPEGNPSFWVTSYLFFSKILCYYFIGIWAAYMVYWVVVPNSPGAPWWIYGITLGGFLTAKCIDWVTLSMFAVFCYKPILINVIYCWIPFKSLFLYYPW